jgi:4-hydroxybenzoyl-CoA reductase subunit beta
MLRLPKFGVVTPDTIEGVVAAMQQPGARIIAGGTDILPNLKHRLDTPPVLVSLTRVDALRHVTRDDDNGVLRVGSGVTLSDLAENADVRELFPSFATAASVVASPSIRNMGTIGGNINLDTRCRYVNQSSFWRSAIGGCLKAEGVVCHVVPGGKNCVAAMSSDCAPVLTTLDAEVVLVGPDGERAVPIADYYNTDGVAHINKSATELTTELRIPYATGPRRATYAKWTVRSSIDFPLVSVAMRFDLDSDSTSAKIVDARVCVGVLNARPRTIKRTDALSGMQLDAAATADKLCDLVHRQSKTLENVPYEAPYRRKMIPVYARRALRQLLEQ